VTAELEAAGDPFRLGRRQQEREIVATLGVPGREDFACRGLLQDPFERFVAGTPQVGSDADPVDMHVDAEGGRRRVVGEASLALADVGQRQALSAELLGDVHREIAGLPQILEVLLEEAIVPIVGPDTLRESLQKVVGQHVIH